MAEYKLNKDLFASFMIDLVHERYLKQITEYEMNKSHNINLVTLRKMERGEMVNLNAFIKYVDVLGMEIVVRHKSVEDEKEKPTE